MLGVPRKKLSKSGKHANLLKLGNGVVRPISRKDFKEIRLIGKGNVGRVYLVRLRGTKEVYAMKVLSKDEMIAKNKVERVLTEREILATSDHPFIVTLHWCWQSDRNIYFVMDYCDGGQFFSILQKRPGKRLPESAVKFYCAEVLCCFEYLHLMGFIYRDLKPENILMNRSGHIMLTDFDLSKISKGKKKEVVKERFGGDIISVDSKVNMITNSFVGTADYLAPEVISGLGHGGTVDWWTLGVLIYEMLFGFPPFKGKNRDEIFQKVMENKINFPENIKVSKECKDVIRKLLRSDQKKRLGSQHGAADIKAHPFFKDVKWALLRDQRPPLIPKCRNPLEDDDGNDEVDDVWDNEWELTENDPFKRFQDVHKKKEKSLREMQNAEEDNIENE